MVDTMALLPPFMRGARIARGAGPHPSGPRPAGAEPGGHLAAGLPADDEVLLDAPDDRLGPALVAAGRQEWTAAARLLSGTRGAAEWENRDRYARRLAAFAHARTEWFESWRAAPGHQDDPDALLVAAQLAADRAWRSPARAELLAPVEALVTAAAEAVPRDPVPWRLALDRARGAHAGHTEFERLWTEAVRRSPHHYGCHVAALKYLGASWHGSHRECFDFAEPAADDAPPGSLVRALPVRAAFGYLTDGCGEAVPRVRLDAAADRAIELSGAFAPADPWPAEIRNVLAYVLLRLERRADALEQLRLIGPYATSFPWDRVAEDPLGLFLLARRELRAAPTGALWTASTLPSGGHGGRAHRGDH
ncbi:hypothetical protein AB0D49_16360 [Streptomyces sp. NPDC048290]|uniref:hypothetical protein n=1 Tax=Streptomyces sp. NPDC048290 TaxID=3155811 RepID=UPI003412C5A9